jgi:hypothetical protein
LLGNRKDNGEKGCYGAKRQVDPESWYPSVCNGPF